MKLGIVVHGPQIIDSGYALNIIKQLETYGELSICLGGTMGRTAVIDANLEDTIDIGTKRIPSKSIDKLYCEDKCELIFLLNSGKSTLTGHTFGYKVFNRSCKPPLIQIERPDHEDGCIIPWIESVHDFAKELSEIMNLKLVTPNEVKTILNINPINHEGDLIKRKIAGVSPNENIFFNGIVIGRSNSDDVTLIAKDGVIIDIEGGQIKEHGVEKLGKIDITKGVIKTGLLRRSKITTPRIIKQKSKNSSLKAAFLNHAAEDVYKFKGIDVIVTIGDDTTLVSSDILYRFDVPIIGITDGDLDKVVENGFKNKDSLIIEFESGWDDKFGDKIFNEIFKNKEIIQINNIQEFKDKIINLINKTNIPYKIKK